MQKLKKLNTKGISHIIFALAVVVIGIGGSLYLVETHAATPPSCLQLEQPNKSAVLCANLNKNNKLSASVVYTGLTSKDTLTSGITALYACTKVKTPICVVALSTITIDKSRLLTNKKTEMSTATATYNANYVYKACTTFVSTSSWKLGITCTSIVSFGSGHGDDITMYPPKITSPGTGSGTASDVSSCSGETLPAKSDGTPWTCSFDEEFNGSSLDPSKWTVQLTSTSAYTTGPYSPAGLLACYVDSPNNISVANGVLNLTVRKEAAPFNCPGLPAADSTTSYTAGTVTTINHFSQQNGHFEVRAKFPNTTAQGLQETLWLWPNNSKKYGSEPASGEIDFAELYSKYANTDVPAVHNTFNAATTDLQTYTNVPHQFPAYTVDGTPSRIPQEPNTNCRFDNTQFNDFSLTWTPNQLQMYVNGALCLVDNYSSTQGGAAPFDQPFFIALTQALGIYGGSTYGDNSFNPAVTPLPATTQVDYVRVWK